VKLKEKIKEIPDEIDKFLILNSIGSFFNFMEDAVLEIGDDEITEKFNELMSTIRSKRMILYEMEIES